MLHSWNERREHVIYLVARNKITPNVEPSKVLSLSDLNNYRSLSVDPCSYWGAHNSRLALFPSLTRAQLNFFHLSAANTCVTI